MEQELVNLALNCGGAKAVILSQEQIHTSPRFRAICETGQCGSYGRCWMCPPFIGQIQPLIQQVRQYPKALWFQTISSIEDSFDIEGMFAAGSRHAQVSLAIQEKLRGLPLQEFLLLTCGGCHICPSCAKAEDKPCRYPQKALRSLEGYGVDVYATTQGTDLAYTNGENTVTYFGMVLYRE